MEAAFKIAVMLTAFDKMSEIVNKATGNAEDKLKHMATMKFAEGSALIGAGMSLAKSLDPAIEAFGEAQAAGNELKASMMTKGGLLDEATYKKIYGLSNDLSDKYKGSTSSYLEMVKVLKDNRISEQDVLGGIGEATAKLADYFQMTPATIAEFAAHMKNDMGVSVGEMDKMMDMIARVHNAGVGKTGSEAVTEMNEFFSKASLGAANLGVQGIEASKSLGALGALFMSRGLSGQTVGTNFRRIFDGMRDMDKVKKANEVAGTFGKHLNLFDKHGKFLGIDNFVQQLGKLENLNPSQIQAVLKPFGGKQGLSTDFLEYLGKHGLEGFKEYHDKLTNQATLDEKLKKIMEGLNYQHGVMQTSWTNLKATFGATMQPVLDKFYQFMNYIIPKIREFISHHPGIARFIATFVALASAALMVAGVIKVIQGITIAMKFLNITMAANPFMLWVTIAILAVSLIIAYWDKIIAFFSFLWEKVKQIFFSVWNWIKKMFMIYTPEGLIIKHWDKIKSFFSGLWNKVKQVFTAFWNWLKGAGAMIFNFIAAPYIKVWNWLTGFAKGFYNAGKSIVMNIWQGIKDFFNHPIEKVKEMVGKIRRLLPFSPAKDGPLRDIHKIRLVETIADSIRPNSLVDKMRNVAKLSFDVMAGKPGKAISPVGASGGGASNINFNITLNGSATKNDAQLIMNEIKKQFPQLMKQYQGQQSRISLG
jgi:TP901 family phage tail tape measure protein